MGFSRATAAEADRIIFFTKGNPDKGFAHLFEQDELMCYYDDWEILHYNGYLTDLEEHNNIKPHRHFIAEIIARKDAV